MTAAERAKRYRDRKRREREAAPEAKRARRRKQDRNRKRAERAAVKAASDASLPPASAMPSDLVAWCEALTVTQGEGAGELLTLLEWEAAFLRSVEASAAGELGLSVPAGAGKTTLAAAVGAAGVAGPLAQRRAVVLLVAASFTQALIAFDHAHAFLQPMIEAAPDRWRVLRSEQTALIEDRQTGAVLRAREANARDAARAGGGAGARGRTGAVASDASRRVVLGAPVAAREDTWRVAAGYRHQA